MKTILLFLIAIASYPICNAQNWESFGTPNWFPRCMYADTAEKVLYVGGGFKTIDGQVIRGIGKWDGTQWHDLDLGMDTIQIGNPQNVLAITKYQGEIIAAGSFKTAGGAESRYISRWDGSAWHPFNGQPNEGLEDLLVYDNKLYVCGGFDSLGTIKANGVGMWDGSNWHAIGNLPDYDPNPFTGNVIFALTQFQGNIYISGLMIDSSQSFYHSLAWFDGIKWQYFQDDLKGGLAGGWDLEVYNNELYVAGYFTVLDGNYDNCIQRWNGTSWNSVGGGTDGPNETIWKIKEWNNKLYAVGTFATAGGVPANKVAFWDGNKWCGLGSAINGDVTAIDFYRDTLHIVGGFKIIDNDSIIFLAKYLGGDYVDTCSTPVGINEINYNQFNFSFSPNPVTTQLNLTLGISTKPYQLKILNTLGQILQQQIFSSSQLSINIADLPSGIYLLQVQNENERVIKKFVKE